MSAVLFLLGGAVPAALAGPAIYPLPAAQITWTLITAVTLIIADRGPGRNRPPDDQDDKSRVTGDC